MSNGEIGDKYLSRVHPFRISSFGFRAPRRKVGLLGIAFLFGIVAGGPSSFGQYPTRRAPSFERRLLNRLDGSTTTRPADLPDLSRLLLLETISMHEYVRRGHRGSLSGERLLGEIDVLWDAAADFDLIIDRFESGRPVEESPAEALADLEGAYALVASDLGAMPGLARFAAFRLGRVSRLLDEIRPRVGPSPSSGTSAAIGDFLGAFRREVRSLAGPLDELLGLLKTSAPPPAPGEAGPAVGVERLRALVQGLDRLLAGRPAPEDVLSAFRPVRHQATRLDGPFLNRALPADVRARWRAIQDGIDRLSDRFSLPRVIVLSTTSPAARTPSPEALARIDPAVSEIDAFLVEIAPASVSLPDKARVEDDAHRLRTLLLLFRQGLVAGLPGGSPSPSLGEIERASRRLAEHVQSSLARRQGLDFPRIREVDRLVNELVRAPAAP